MLFHCISVSEVRRDQEIKGTATRAEAQAPPTAHPFSKVALTATGAEAAALLGLLLFPNRATASASKVQLVLMGHRKLNSSSSKRVLATGLRSGRAMLHRHRHRH